jgi:tetratricopeptide (TPR) repeat protein
MQNGQVANDFIGRKHELEIFKQWLVNTSPDAHWILHFYDAMEAEEKKGGVGKTWLMRKCATIARQYYPDMTIVPIDFFNVADRDGVVIADHVVDALKSAYPEWSPSSFAETLIEYNNASLEGREDVAEVRNRLSDALAVELSRLDEQLLEARKHILLLFDTFELVEQNPVIAVLRLSQTFPDNYHFQRIGVVMAGRKDIDWTHANWKGRDQEVLRVPVSPFNSSEMLQYIEMQFHLSMPIQSAQLDALIERTEGRPIMVGLVTDVLNNHIMQLKELIAIPKGRFEPILVAKINNLEKPIDEIVLFMAHVYHRFNFHLLEWILRESESPHLLQYIPLEELSQKLLNLSFVRRPSSGNDFVLHDEMRRLVTQYCWDIQDTNQSFRKEISRRVILYYEQELSREHNHQLQQAYTVEMLYHRLFVDLDEGFSYFQKNFHQAVNLLMTPYARSLLQEIKKFIKRLSLEQRMNVKFAEIRLLQREENATAALKLFTELEQEADQQWLEENRADILYEKGVCYQQQSNFSEAITYFTASLGIEKEAGHMSDYAYLLNWLGYIYRRLGQLDVALHYFEEGIEIHRQLGSERAYANGLNSIGNVYRLQGKIEEALRRCKISWRIRHDLFKQGKMSEVYVAWSLSSIGAIYLHIDDLVRAEQVFQEAYDIFSRTGHKKGVATICNRFGQIDMVKGDLIESMQWFKKAYYTSQGIDTEAQINSLNKQGWILVLENKWDAAVELLNQAIELASSVHDDYQQAESLIDLADVLEREEKHEESQRALQEAEEIAQKYNYNYLLGLARESQGDIRYHRGEYQNAFVYYREACRFMALYNSIKYTKTLRKVIDALLETPYKEIDDILESMMAYWHSQELNKTHPDFITSCEEVGKLIKA